MQESKRSYFFCSVCEGIFVHPDCFLNGEAEKSRYNQHNNTLQNAGYVRFLHDFINPVLTFLPQKPSYIIDYGSGKNAPMLTMLESYKKNGSLDPKCILQPYDLFFAQTELKANSADVVFCLETAEHFKQPQNDFLHISNTLKKGGFLAVGTMLIPAKTDFLKWWYKNDMTHVAFYSVNALNSCTKSAGLFLVKNLSERCFLFEKK